MAKGLWERYSAASYELSPEPAPSLPEILSLKSAFWAQSSTSSPDSVIPQKTRDEFIHTFLMMKRCKEETKLLQADMLSTLQYWLDRVKCIDDKLMELQASPNIQYCRGVICLLTHLKHDSEIEYKKATYIFSKCIDVPRTEDTSDYSNETYSSDSDEETGSEDSDCDF